MAAEVVPLACRIKIAVLDVNFGAERCSEFLEQLKSHSKLLYTDLRINPEVEQRLIPTELQAKKKHTIANRRVFVDFFDGLDRAADLESFELFQVYRRVLAVVGVIPEATDANRRAFREQLRQFPHLLANSLVIPSALSPEGVREFVVDLVSAVLAWFSQYRAELMQCKHSSPLDLDSRVLPRILSKASSKEDRLAKINRNRADKLSADLLILSGHYKEAVEM